MRDIILIAHNLRSTHNVGSLFRTADGLGVHKLILSGYTPHPHHNNDRRLPHESAKTTNQINKTALGAEKSVNWEWHRDVLPVINKLRKDAYTVAALEQTEDAKDLTKYHPPQKIAIVVGNEPDGLDLDVLNGCDIALEIPMLGKKESYNVSVAAAIALYHCRSY